MTDKNGSIRKFCFVWYFLVGYETYYISPTAWLYIKSLGQTKFFLALVLASFNITSLIAGPVIGFLADRFGKPRFMFLSCCVMKVLAYLIYSINLSAYFPLVGRLISGFGNGAGYAILLGQVVLQTDEESRGKRMLQLSSIYIVGSAFGPGIGSFLTFRVNIFGWKINDGNSPGIVLTAMWLVFLFLSLLFPDNMWVKTGAQYKRPISCSSDDENNEKLSECRENGNRKSTGYDTEENSNIEWDSRMICLFFLIFTSEFFSSTSTFYVPVLALDHFHLQIIHTKLLFLDCTIFTLVIFLSFHIASNYADERKLFVIALFMQITAISLLTSIAFSWDKVTSSQYYILLSYICVGMPYFAYPFANSILSKITNPRNASFIQGLAFAAVMLAIVLSRVVISFIFTKTSLTCYCFVLVFIWLFGFTWYGKVYKRLRPKDP